MNNNNIHDKIYLEGINLNLSSKNKNSLLKEMYKGLEKSKYVIDKEKAFEDLMSREIIGTTGIGNGVAIPHAKTDTVTNTIITIGISKEGIDYEAIDGKKVHIFFMFLTPIDMSKEYLMTLAKIARFCQEESFRDALYNAKTKEEVFDIIKNME